MKTKFMTLMTVATLGIFSAATVMAAGNNDFYTQPPAGSEWEKADTEGTYASYTNGNDYVNIYKYSLEDVKTCLLYTSKSEGPGAVFVISICPSGRDLF